MSTTQLHATFTRRQILAACSICMAAPLLACTQPHGLVKISRHTWPGYMLLDLARDHGWLPEDQFRLINLGSAKGTLRALASNSIDVACLTLDEVLTARANGLELVIIGLINFSRGADVVIARKPLTIEQLTGKTIGFESGAVGQVMLHQLLQAAHLTTQNVKLASVTADEHESRFTQGEFDALITYEPIASNILQQPQFQRIYSSRQCPDLIADVFASTSDAIEHHGPQLTRMLNAHYRAQQLIRLAHPHSIKQLASHLAVNPEELQTILAGLDLVDRKQALDWLTPKTSRTEETIRQLMQILQLNNKNMPKVEHMITAQFLEVQQ
ncbi:ABC transporter substrate-binding protein [Chitinibacter sp. SCUT-21]|uniref:ABC transporter substrate-binding protein n=1 Tax=Chitinibacter sp. SCUT-21 TaxID=2970891 RepID=UPI0035A7280C